jgi:antirestriction protein ArdC
MTKPRGSQAPRLDLYQQVTNQIIAALEQGVRPWTKPWSADHLATRVSRPLRACGKGYRGINVLILWLTGSARGCQSPFWLTFKQALDLGGHVRKGEKGAPVCYYDTFTKETADDTGAAREEQIPFLKHYTVFNADQCDGLPAHFHPPVLPEPAAETEAGRIDAVDRFIANLGAEIIDGGNRACYAQNADRISMPPFATFTTPTAYYSTLLHEMVHWTKHPVRLDRDCGRKQWGDEGYALEELVAELGSAYLCADLEVGLSEREDHASYIASWLTVLKNDKRAIFHAAAMAERAAAWLHACQPGIGEGAPEPAAGSGLQPLPIAA